MAEYQGSIELISGIVPKNGQSFPLVNAPDIQVSANGKRLDEWIRDAESASGRNTYIWSQDQAASVWTITHNLDSYPAVAVVDSAGSIVVGEVQYINRNTVVCSFTGAFSGKAYLN